MGEALEKAKGNLGLNGTTKSVETEAPKPDALTDLENAIKQVENIEAKELLQSKARELRAQLELRAREAESRARQYDTTGRPAAEENNGDAKIRAKQEMIGNSLVLLERGVDPDVVARYIIGSQGAAYPVNFGGGQQGLTINDIKTIVDMVKGSGGLDPQVAEVIRSLKEKVDSLKPAGNNAPVNPIDAAMTGVKAINDLVNSFVEAGLVVRPGNGHEGESIDEIREKNRHDERMVELDNDKDYKSNMADIASQIPERIGRGLAADMRHRGGQGGGKGGVLDSFPCEKCGAKILVTPETGNRVKCGNCGMVYERGETSEEKTSQPAKSPISKSTGKPE